MMIHTMMVGITRIESIDLDVDRGLIDAMHSSSRACIM